MPDSVTQFGPDAFERFAEIAKAVNRGGLQAETDKHLAAAQQHRDDAAAAEAAAVKELQTINANKTTLAEIDRKTAALERGKTKLANDKEGLDTTRREFDEYRDAENASMDARGEQLTKDEEAAAAVLAMQSDTEAANAEAVAMKAQYEAKLAAIGLQPA